MNNQIMLQCYIIVLEIKTSKISFAFLEFILFNHSMYQFSIKIKEIYFLELNQVKLKVRS